MSHRLKPILLMATGLLPAVVAANSGTSPSNASWLDDWHITGTNTTRAEYYANWGDETSAIFPNEGRQGFNELNLQFKRQFGAHDLFKGQIQVLANGSDYRSRFDGLQLERFNLQREKGDVSLPYRWEVGDFFGFYSLRSIQRSLKGVRFEVQPLSKGKLKQSLEFIIGGRDATWEEFSKSDDATLGLSYLIQHEDFGRWAANAVRNVDKTNPGGIDRTLTQWVLSIAGLREFTLGSQALTLQGEYGYLHGDHQAATNVTDGGAFVQFSGKPANGPYHYRLRWERYGQNYRPDGASISPDRRSLEFHGGWKFKAGLNLRGRVQAFRDQLESANPIDTHTVGLGVNGPIGLGISASVDSFVQEVSNQDDSTERLTQSLNINLSRKLWGDVSGTLGGSWQHLNDKANNSTPTINRQLTMGLNFPVQWGNWRGGIAPNLLYRRVSGDNRSIDVGPRLSANIGNKQHAVSMNIGSQNQRREGGNDIITDTAALTYRYTQGPHSVGLEYNYTLRDPDPGESTEGNKISAFYRYQINKPAGGTATTGSTLAALPTPPGPLRLADLPPGTTLAQAETLLNNKGIRNGVPIPGYLVYDARLYPELDQRQRVVLGHQSKQLQMAATIIDFDNVGNADNLRQTFERVREVLIKRYGNPSNFFEEGDFNSPNLASDLRDGRLIRIFEWTVGNATVRFGIPRRLDGQLRMEVQSRQSFPDVRDTLWSVEEVI